MLGRDDIGALAPGMAADIVTIPLDDIGLAGALHDPLAALFFCHVPRVKHSVVNGRVVVRDGQLTTLDLPRLIERHNRLARQLVTPAAAGEIAAAAGGLVLATMTAPVQCAVLEW